MPEDWTAIVAEVNEALISVQDVNEPGKGIATFSRAGTLDESTYPPTTSAATTAQVNVVQALFSDRDKDNENIRDGDVRLLVPATQSFVPQNGDDVIFGGRDYSVESVERVAPAGVTVMFKVRARGA